MINQSTHAAGRRENRHPSTARATASGGALAADAHRPALAEDGDP
jgi:hypothetical protein